MDLSLRGFCSIFFVLAWNGVHSAEIAQYLPKNGRMSGKVMQLVAPRDYVAIAEKAKLAMQKDSEWFQQYVKEHPKGTLPYHPRLGITEKEYKRFIQGAGVMQLRETGPITITATPLAQGGLELMTDNFSSPLNGIRIFPSQSYVETRYGKLQTFSEINQNNRESPTGRWRGVQWKQEEQIGNGGVVIKFALGKRQDRGDGILYYDVNRVLPGTQERYDVIVVYPLQQ